MEHLGLMLNPRKENHSHLEVIRTVIKQHENAGRHSGADFFWEPTWESVASTDLFGGIVMQWLAVSLVSWPVGPRNAKKVSWNSQKNMAITELQLQFNRVATCDVAGLGRSTEDASSFWRMAKEKKSQQVEQDELCNLPVFKDCLLVRRCH